MAKSIYFPILLFGLLLSSCDNLLSNRFGAVREIEIGDTIKVVTYETRYKTIYDTVFVEIPRPSTKQKAFTDTLRSYIGTREATGRNDGVAVERFTREACNMGQVAWCAAFLAYGLKVNGVETPECACWSPCMVPNSKVVWRRGETRVFEEGEIFGLYFKSKGRVAHVGAVLEDFGDGWILTIEGNTNDAGSREGDGVYTRLRHKSQIFVLAKWV